MVILGGVKSRGKMLVLVIVCAVRGSIIPGIVPLADEFGPYPKLSGSGKLQGARSWPSSCFHLSCLLVCHCCDHEASDRGLHSRSVATVAEDENNSVPGGSIASIYRHPGALLAVRTVALPFPLYLKSVAALR